jgi:hypothetical protein
MGLDTIPSRSDGQKIDQTWFNIIRSALNGDFVPRDSDGIATDEGGSLGSTTYRWLHAFVSGLYVFNGTRSVKIEAPSGIATDFTIKLPTALPASGSKIWFIDNTGQSTVTLDVDNSTLETSGSTVRVKEGGITRPKLASLGQQISSSCGAYSSTSNADITNLSVSLTTTGRPVFIGLISDGSGNDSTVGSVSSNSGIQFKRGATSLARNILISGTYAPSSSFWTVDVVSAGTYTYTAAAVISSGTINVNYAKLIAFEL